MAIPPLGFDGKSFVSVLEDKTQRHNDTVFCGQYYARNLQWFRSLQHSRGHRRKLALHPWLASLHQFQNVITHRNNVFISWRNASSHFASQQVARYLHRPAEELYELKTDPWCLRNIAGKASTGDIQEALSEFLDAWMKQQGDQGDATERAAKERQPQVKPWSRKDRVTEFLRFC